MLVVLGELGGRDEYSLVVVLKQGKISKHVVAWLSGTYYEFEPITLVAEEGKIYPVKEVKLSLHKSLRILILLLRVEKSKRQLIISTVSDVREYILCGVVLI
ncbi:uncharacterized protein LOC131300990 isoform X2 [Rhododendron vialii]|uniref:uncharacterized protein LOC131300990 isoform X2 n=1 Tax=Rhododendron vialii TaxID=182163 RepID=UPI00265F7430|nr:uncharacterized protein LOC131300990 isoform X2 [Rhododendron vialii]